MQPASRLSRRNRSPRLWSALLFACVVQSAAAVTLIAPDSHAQGDGETLVARQRFEEGVRHYDNQEFDKARLAFLQAYLLKAHPAVLLNLAQSELKSGRHAEAAENFSKYIRENPNAKAIEHAKAALDEARGKVAEVNVVVTAPDAQVSVDGREVGVSPLPEVLYLMPGSHKLEARKGTVSANRTLEAIPGQRVYVTLELTDAGMAAVPAPVTSTAPSVPAPVVPIEPGAPAAQGAPPMDEGGSQGFLDWLGNSPGAIATVTVAGLSLGTSAVLAGFARDRYSAASNARDQIMEDLARLQSPDEVTGESVLTGGATPCGEDGLANGVGPINPRLAESQLRLLTGTYATACKRFRERSDSGDRLKTLSLISLGVGVAATMGTVVWYFTDTGGRRQDSAKGADGQTGLASAIVSPVLSAETQGVWVEFAF